MLISRGLPQKFWREACRYACIILNVALTKANGNDAPDALFYQKIPKVNRLRIFGTKCLVKDEFPKGKFSSRAIEALYMGPAVGGDGHKLYSLTTSRMITSRNVTFLETTVQASVKVHHDFGQGGADDQQFLPFRLKRDTDRNGVEVLQVTPPKAPAPQVQVPVPVLPPVVQPAPPAGAAEPPSPPNLQDGDDEGRKMILPFKTTGRGEDWKWMEGMQIFPLLSSTMPVPPRLCNQMAPVCTTTRGEMREDWRKTFQAF